MSEKLLKASLSRRALLKAGAVGTGVLAFPMPFIRTASAADTVQLAISLRSLTNPYHANFAKGGQDFAKSVGMPIEVLVTEGNSEKGIADIRALLARSNGNLALCVDPNDSP